MSHEVLLIHNEGRDVRIHTGLEFHKSSLEQKDLEGAGRAFLTQSWSSFPGGLFLIKAP